MKLCNFATTGMPQSAGQSHWNRSRVANIPTTLTYYARFVPASKYKLTFDFGVAQVAGNVNPAIPSLQARHQVGLQMSYGF
jgi:hypothetical protein